MQYYLVICAIGVNNTMCLMGVNICLSCAIVVMLSYVIGQMVKNSVLIDLCANFSSRLYCCKEGPRASTIGPQLHGATL